MEKVPGFLAEFIAFAIPACRQIRQRLNVEIQDLVLTRIPVELVRLAGVFHNAVGPQSRCTIWRLDAGAPVSEHVPIFLDGRVGLRSNTIRSNLSTIVRGMRVQSQEHGRRFRTVDSKFEPYTDKYGPLLFMCWVPSAAILPSLLEPMTIQEKAHKTYYK